MKTGLFLMLTLASINSFADEDPSVAAPSVVASCKESPEIRDAGYLVTITRNNGLIATVTQQSIAGPRIIGSSVVKQIDGSMVRTFKGKGFSLAITLESFAPTPNHPATLVTSLKGFKQALNKSLTCTVQ